jgi:hypothetical protein
MGRPRGRSYSFSLNPANSAGSVSSANDTALNAQVFAADGAGRNSLRAVPEQCKLTGNGLPAEAVGSIPSGLSVTRTLSGYFARFPQPSIASRLYSRHTVLLRWHVRARGGSKVMPVNHPLPLGRLMTLREQRRVPLSILHRVAYQAPSDVKRHSLINFPTGLLRKLSRRAG